MKQVTEQELQEIKTLRESLVEIVTVIGELHLNELIAKNQLTEIQNQVSEQEQKFLEFQQKERVLFDSLQQKYGTGNINLETGEITD